MFRGYLRCLTKDYARLLSGIREMMVESGVDRPDLAKALVRKPRPVCSGTLPN